MNDNPLLHIGYEIPFDKIKPEHVVPAIRELIEHAQEEVDAILAVAQSERSFENTILQFDLVGEALGLSWAVVRHLDNVMNSPELRGAIQTVQPEIIEFWSKLFVSEDLWNAVSSFSESDEAKSLTGINKTFLEEILIQFRRNGADLSEDNKKRLIEIKAELGKTSNEFGNNLVDATKAFELIFDSPEPLAGLPEIHLQKAEESAKSAGHEGKWKLSLAAPSVIPSLTYLNDESLREKLHKAYSTRAAGGEFDNTDNIIKLIKLRKEKAKILGYKNYADYQLEQRLAHTGDNALKFERDLEEHCTALFKKESEELRDYKRSLTGDSEALLEPWDIAYYQEKLRKERYDFNENDLRPYLEESRCLDGMFAFTEKLFGIKLTERTDMPTWHEDVKTFRVDDEHGKEIGNIYIDIFPRPGQKREGAWAFSLIRHVPGHEAKDRYLGLFSANLTKPTSDKPALLSFNEVETLYHEFGHLLHSLFTEVEIESLARVPWDFIEVPSQLLENWLWEKEILDTFAVHYETGEKIPQELIDAKLNAKNFKSASFIIRQIGLGTIDLLLHTEYDPDKDGNPLEYAHEVLSKYTPSEYKDYQTTLNTFGHLFDGGYAAGYYSYLWSSVLEADIFEKFKHAGLVNRELGIKLKDQIFKPGKSVDVMELFNTFMGREKDAAPSVDAFLHREGIE